MGDIPEKKKCLKFQIAITDLKVTGKYWVKGRIHASPERKEKTTFCSKSAKKTEARRLNLIKVVHLRWLPRVNWRCAA